MSEMRRIAQYAARWSKTGKRRMMDQHHADDVLFTESCELLGSDLELMLSQLSAGDERRRLDGGVQSDKRDRTDAAHERKGQRIILPSHVLGPPRDAGVAVEARI